MKSPTSPYDTKNASDKPLYNIGVVARMTDIPVATLRVWERRYDFPKSARTTGGHRLYSEQEVLRLRWVKERIDEGMQTGRAIRALHHMEEEGRLTEIPLTALPPFSEASSLSPLPSPIQHHTADPALASLQQHLFASLVAHDTTAAEQILAEAMSLHPLENLILDMIQPTLSDIGQAWADGEVNVATEHLASNFLRHRLLLWLATGPQPRQVPPVVLACAPDEWHEGSLLMTGVLLRRQAWPVSYLGQAVPLPDLANYVHQVKPSVVVLLSIMEKSVVHLPDWPHYLPEAYKTGRPPVCFGGNVFTHQPEWRDRVPGIFLGETIQEGLVNLDQILRDVNG